MINLTIPAAYLEGYKKLVEMASNEPFPDSPKVIFTSNSFFMNEVFKVWAAIKTEKNAMLIIGQHGGNYGQGLICSETPEIKISDRYISWGWRQRKVEPLGKVFKRIYFGKLISRKKNLLLTISGTARYSDGLLSMPMSSQWLRYLDNQLDFCKKLPNPIQESILIRPYVQDHGWSQINRWKEQFPNAKFDSLKKSFNSSLMSAKLVVSGWNTTTYLESMGRNIPTIIFWDSEFFELRNEVIPFFEELEKVGIFHKTSKSAAEFVASVWHDINSWWSEKYVVNARMNFTNEFVKPSSLKNYSDFFKSLNI